MVPLWYCVNLSPSISALFLTSPVSDAITSRAFGSRVRPNISSTLAAAALPIGLRVGSRPRIHSGFSVGSGDPGGGDDDTAGDADAAAAGFFRALAA